MLFGCVSEDVAFAYPFVASLPLSSSHSIGMLVVAIGYTIRITLNNYRFVEKTCRQLHSFSRYIELNISKLYFYIFIIILLFASPVTHKQGNPILNKPTY